MEETIDPWDYSNSYNLTPSANTPKKEEAESLMAKAAKKEKSLPQPPNVPKPESKKPESKKPVSGLSMADKYSAAWVATYLKKPKWRQKEIDTTLKSGKLSDESWDNDFVQEVIRLAESGTM